MYCLHRRPYRATSSVCLHESDVASQRCCRSDVRSCARAAGVSLTLQSQDYDGDLSFTVDAWTSPNHKALVAFGVHFTHKGAPMSFLLDLVEIAESHTGEALAKAFANMLKTFGIEKKVSTLLAMRCTICLPHTRSSLSRPTTRRPMTKCLRCSATSLRTSQAAPTVADALITSLTSVRNQYCVHLMSHPRKLER